MNAALAELWPYLLLILVGYLPNEMWRVLGLVLARGLNEDSEIVVWSRAVATAIIAGVIAKLILFAAGALVGIPLAVRVTRGGLRISGFPGGEAFGVRRRAGRRGGAAAGRLFIRALSCALPRGDRRSELLGVFGEDLRLFLLARRWLHGNAGLARDDVNMQMEHDLSAGALIELLYRDAVGPECLYGGFGDLLGYLHHMREIIGTDIENIARGRLWQHQRVTGRARHDVEERERLVVLVDPVAR